MREYKLNPPPGSARARKPEVELTDKSPCPFGKHKGVPMEKVPPQYLLWLWDTGGVHAQPNKAIHRYIRGAWKAIISEFPDYIAENEPRDR